MRPALPTASEAADMTNTLPSKNGSKPRPKRTGKESAVGMQKHKRTATDIGPGADHADRRPGVPGPLQPARSAQPRAQVRRQAGVLRGRRVHPAVQARPGPRQGADPAKDQRRRLLRPHPRRRPEDDRRDRRGVRRRNPAPRRPRRRRRRQLSAGPGRQGRRTRHHRHQRPRGLRRHRRAPRGGHQRARRRGARLRRHGSGAADPGARRRRVGAHPLGQRRSAGDLSEGVRRRERAAGLRRDRRTARAVRPDRAEDDGGPHPQRLPARTASSRWCPPPRTPNCSSSAAQRQRQARAVHRRVVDPGACPSRPIPSMGIRAAALGRVELDNVPCR